jgi:DNA-directed RNA polymerase specialized sigma24 family protein
MQLCRNPLRLWSCRRKTQTLEPRRAAESSLQLTGVSFDAQTADARYRLEPADGQSPAKLFERRWASTPLEQVLARLEREFREAGKAELFQRLRLFLVAGRSDETYAEAAAELGLTTEAVKKAMHRLRQRYYKLFREEIAHTVEDPAEIEDEMRYLCGVMAS